MQARHAYTSMQALLPNTKLASNLWPYTSHITWIQCTPLHAGCIGQLAFTLALTGHWLPDCCRLDRLQICTAQWRAAVHHKQVTIAGWSSCWALAAFAGVQTTLSVSVS